MPSLSTIHAFGLVSNRCVFALSCFHISVLVAGAPSISDPMIVCIMFSVESRH